MTYPDQPKKLTAQKTPIIMRLNARPIRIITFFTDIILINLAFFVAHQLRYDYGFYRPALTFHPYEQYLQQQILFNVLILLMFWQYKVWRRRRGEFWSDEMLRILNATATAIAIMVIYIFVFLPAPFSRLFWALAPAVILVFLGVSRFLRRSLLFFLYARGIGVDRVLIMGAGEVGRSLTRTLLARPDLGFLPIGYMHDGEHNDVMGNGRRIPNLGNFDDLPRVLDQHAGLYTVFVALPIHMHDRMMRIIRVCRQHGVQVQVAPDMFQLSFSKVESINMAGIPMLGVRQVRMSPISQTVKRLIDLLLIVIAAIPALIIGSIIAIAIKLDSHGPVFYAAERVGRGGRIFKMIKFRSMVVDADSQKAALAQLNEAEGPIFKIRDDPRLTRVGRIIRRLSLDELPQLLNVVRGEMSIVGPRPPLKDEVDQYESWHKQRLSVRGGITGLWQVSGRSDLTFDEQALLDIYYIENWSLSLDVRIMLQTIPYALFGRGAY